jgi:plasmid rolling circle replication initiator protein Rep
LKNNIILNAETVKFLSAVEQKSEKNKVAENKKGSEILAFTYVKTSLPDRERKAKRLHLCGKTVTFLQNPKGGDPVSGAVRCKLRFCPSCSFIRARQTFENVYCVITEPDFSCKQFVFLTLTVKNCSSKFLESEIRRILSAWNKLIKNDRQGFARSFSGTFRALEVTYNPVKKNYHPHLHAMAAVDKKYFRKSNKDYISQAELRELWRDACGLDYLPQCRIQRVKNTAKKQVAEVAKYTVKSAAYLNRPAVLETLDPALWHKRLVAYGGLFRDVKKRLDLPDEDDVPETSVPRIKFEELMRNPMIRKAVFEWESGKYYLSQLYEPPNAGQLVSAARQLAGEILGGQGGA